MSSKEQPITVVVSMEGGIVQDISANAPVRVIVHEYDKYLDPREDPERFIAVKGDPHYLQDWTPTGDQKEKEYVSEILKIVDQAPRCDQCGGPRVNESWEYTEEGFIEKDPAKKLCWFCRSEAQERRDPDAKIV